MRRIALITATLLACTIGSHAAAQQSPAPELMPADVVRAQLEGFARGDDAGIAAAYRFASPSNRSMTGPVERFTGMIREQYGELIGHREAALGPSETDDRHTYQGVEITAANGKQHLYLFILSQYDLPDCSSCWMTDGVARRESNPSEEAL